MRAMVHGAAPSGGFGGRGVGLVALAVALFSASSVLSQPSGGGWGPVADRVRELEARVGQLERRLSALERVPEPARVTTSVKAFPDAVELGYESCEPPTVADSLGVRLLKAGCELHAPGNPCEPLYVVDRMGIKTRRPGCDKLTPAISCDPPYVVNAAGARVVRRECLDVGY